MPQAPLPILLALAFVLPACDDGRDGPAPAGDPDLPEATTSARDATATEAGADAPASTGDDAPLGLDERCDEESDACGPDLRCLLGRCTWACGEAEMCCPAGSLCGGIEYECRPPAPDWCGDPCDGQAWHACSAGQSCVLDDDGVGHCTDA